MAKSFNTEIPDPIKLTVSVSLEISGVGDDLAETFGEAFAKYLNSPAS
jgi:hypothetical protein